MRGPHGRAHPNMVELISNLAWLLVCGLAVLWWARQERASKQSFSIAKSLLVLLCISMLLFPVISVSDDLVIVLSFTETKGRVHEALQDVARILAPDTFIRLAATDLLISPQSGAARAYLRSRKHVKPALQLVFFSPSIEKRPPPMTVSL